MKPEGHLIPTNELVFDINIDMILVTEIVHISLFRPKGVCIVLPFFMGVWHLRPPELHSIPTIAKSRVRSEIWSRQTACGTAF